VHRQIAIVGIASWQSLSDPARFNVTGNIERGLSSPSIGASAAVVAVLKNSFPGADIDFFQRLGGILVKIEWLTKNQLGLADLTLTYWDRFTSVQRNSLTAKVADVVARTGNPTLIKLMEESGVASAICPYLPMDDRFTRLCID
jgi:hypothetical protein